MKKLLVSYLKSKLEKETQNLRIGAYMESNLPPKKSIEIPNRKCFMNNPTRNLLGYNQMKTKPSHSKNGFDTLKVRGTFDSLSKTNFSIKKITQTHPTDDSFSRRVAVLSPQGHLKLKRLREEFIERQKRVVVKQTL